MWLMDLLMFMKYKYFILFFFMLLSVSVHLCVMTCSGDHVVRHQISIQAV